MPNYNLDDTGYEETKPRIVYPKDMKRRYITKIIIHCSDSLWGDFKAIDDWHSQRKDQYGNPWRGVEFLGKRIYCGYHYIILNGHPEYNSAYDPQKDGVIEKGRPDDFVGSHCLGQNLHSIGICLIGKTEFTKKQFKALSGLIGNLFHKNGIEEVYGHCDFSPKTCPNFDVKDYMARWKAGYWD